MTESGPLAENTRRRPSRLALVAVVLLLVAQIAIATAALAADRPARYGWQMYSGTPKNPAAWVIRDGRTEELDVRDLLVWPRAEIDRVAVVEHHACSAVEADAIRYDTGDGEVTTVECR